MADILDFATSGDVAHYSKCRIWTTKVISLDKTGYVAWMIVRLVTVLDERSVGVGLDAPFASIRQTTPKLSTICTPSIGTI